MTQLGEIDDEDSDVGIALAKQVGEQNGFTLGDDAAWRVLMEGTGFPAVTGDALRARLKEFFGRDYALVERELEELVKL